MNLPAAAHRDMLLQLLPPGRAWPCTADSVLGGMLAGLAEEFARADVRLDDLLDEIDPRTTLELLADWERVAGLPDACSGVPDGIAERQLALANKIAQRGGQSIGFFEGLAARLGYYVEITEETSCDAGFGCGAELLGDAGRFAWTVDAIIGADEYRSNYAEFSAGSSAGERLIGFGAVSLECLIGRAKPAHTDVLFTYSIEAEPAFWFDFTSES